MSVTYNFPLPNAGRWNLLHPALMCGIGIGWRTPLTGTALKARSPGVVPGSQIHRIPVPGVPPKDVIVGVPMPW